MTRINARQRPRPQQYAPYELYTHTLQPTSDEAPHERTSDVRTATGGGAPGSRLPPQSPAIFG